MDKEALGFGIGSKRDHGGAKYKRNGAGRRAQRGLWGGSPIQINTPYFPIQKDEKITPSSSST